MATQILGQGKGRRPQIKDRSGVVYGRLTALEHVASRISDGSAVWRCLCECGKTHDVIGRLLGGKNGVRSCGCLLAYKNTLRPVRGSTNIAHGHSGNKAGPRSPEYQTWLSMRQRCGDAKHSNFADYGGRGISVCARWQSFELFLADMGTRPAGTTLDREDHNGNYEPGNCRWATNNQQAGNRRSNRFVLLAGEKLTVIDAARKCGVPMRTVYHWHKRVGEMGSIDQLLAERAAI